MNGPVLGVMRGAAGGAARYLVTDVAVLRAVSEPVRQVFLSGATITIPFVVTLVVLGVILDFVANLLAPFARVLVWLGLAAGQSDVLALGLVAGILVALVFVAGVLAKSGPATDLGRGIGHLVESVPAVGPVYSSFARMSDVMLDSDTTSFREVKLVEFPHTDVYSLAFQTSTIHVELDDEGATEELLVLFVPLAPNPVMGGFMVCIPPERAYEVDITVQEAFQALVTSGVAMTEPNRTHPQRQVSVPRSSETG